jgi:hypothetical protein
MSLRKEWKMSVASLSESNRKSCEKADEQQPERGKAARKHVEIRHGIAQRARTRRAQILLATRTGWTPPSTTALQMPMSLSVFGSTGQACVPRTNLSHALAAYDNLQDAGEISFTVGFFLSQGESTEGRASTL